MVDLSNFAKPVISVAPMMDWTDRHCRFFHRLLSPSSLLYTEMVTSGAIIHGDADRHLRYDNAEHPVALQLGGSSPDDLARAVEIALPYNYDEINLNCGCPSDRVQNGAFGACLMGNPDLVGQCVKAMQDVSNAPVTVKCRIGIDDADEQIMLREFIKIVSGYGCQSFSIHARKAWLKGLSPKENRDIPPLDYDLAAAIKSENPHLQIHLNGGITSIEQIEQYYDEFDGFMIGRAAYHSPRLLVDLERRFFNQDWQIDDTQIIEKMIDYANAQYEQYGTPIKTVTKHMINFYQGVKGARKWRQYISENAHKVTNAKDVLIPAFDALNP